MNSSLQIESKLNKSHIEMVWKIVQADLAEPLQHYLSQLEHPSLTHLNYNNESLLHHVIKSGSVKCLKTIIEFINSNLLKNSRLKYEYSRGYEGYNNRLSLPELAAHYFTKPNHIKCFALLMQANTLLRQECLRVIKESIENPTYITNKFLKGLAQEGRIIIGFETIPKLSTENPSLEQYETYLNPGYRLWHWQDRGDERIPPCQIQVKKSGNGLSYRYIDYSGLQKEGVFSSPDLNLSSGPLNLDELNHLIPRILELPHPKQKMNYNQLQLALTEYRQQKKDKNRENKHSETDLKKLFFSFGDGEWLGPILPNSDLYHCLAPFAIYGEQKEKNNFLNSEFTEYRFIEEKLPQPQPAKNDFFQMIITDQLPESDFKWLQSKELPAIQARQNLFEQIMALTPSDFLKFDNHKNIFFHLEEIFKNDNEYKNDFQSRSASDPTYSLAFPSCKEPMLKQIQDKYAAIIRLKRNSIAELTNLRPRQLDNKEEREIEEENAAITHAKSKLLTADELNKQPIQFVYELLTNKDSRVKIPISVQNELRYADGFRQKLYDYIDSLCINFSSIDEANSFKEIIIAMKNHRIFAVMDTVVVHPMGGAIKYDANKDYRDKLNTLEILIGAKIKSLQSMHAPQRASVTKAPLKFLFKSNGSQEVDKDHAEYVRNSSQL